MKDERERRQLEIVVSKIASYKKGECSLQSIINTVEGVWEFVNSEEWRGVADRAILELEQINAAMIEDHRQMKYWEKSHSSKYIDAIEAISLKLLK